MGYGAPQYGGQNYGAPCQMYGAVARRAAPPSRPPPRRAAWTRHAYEGVVKAIDLLIYMRVPRTPAPLPVDPGVWERKWDLDSGVSFYENSVTGERSFDKPKEYDRLALATANAVARKAAATQAAHAALAEAAALEGGVAGPGDAPARDAYAAYPGQGAPMMGGPEKVSANCLSSSSSCSFSGRFCSSFLLFPTFPEKRKAELPPGVRSWKDYTVIRKRKKLMAKHAWLFERPQ